MISNLGTIARSGSKAFMTEMAEKGDLNPEAIIGQFGVGFYSAFMVADKIEVFSKHRQAETGHAWESDGTGKYTIQVGDLPWLKCTLLYVDSTAVTHILGRVIDWVKSVQGCHIS